MVDGNAITFLFGAGGASTVDDDLGGGLLHRLALLHCDGLGGYANRLAAGLPTVIQADQAADDGAGNKQPGDPIKELHAQLPLPQLL